MRPVPLLHLTAITITTITITTIAMIHTAISYNVDHKTITIVMIGMAISYNVDHNTITMVVETVMEDPHHVILDHKTIIVETDMEMPYSVALDHTILVKLLEGVAKASEEEIQVNQDLATVLLYLEIKLSTCKYVY